jgi:N utilization substance protein B
LDEAIDKAAVNFDISRFSKVDLAILRLASWEILKVPKLDAAVSINEAIELARSFSGEEAASFVNGILDQIAKN